MANLSWQLYKGYYKGFNDWANLKSNNIEIKDRIEKFFIEKNNAFLNFVLKATEANPQQITLYTKNPGLLIGSGYAHGAGGAGEFKLGFHLDYTTGLPIIPGSSVKGALRSEFPQFETVRNKPWELEKSQNDVAEAKAAFIAEHLQMETTKDKSIIQQVHELEMTIFEGLNINDSTVEQRAVYCSLYDRDIFEDAWPIKGNRGNKLFGTDSITPHKKQGMSYDESMLKNPVPLLFLKVLPNVGYEFRFKFGKAVIHNVNTEKKKRLFAFILKTFGIGAKTNVGYGKLAEEITIPTPTSSQSGTSSANTNQPFNGQRPASQRSSEDIAAANRLANQEAEKLLKQQQTLPDLPSITVTEKEDWPVLSQQLKGQLIPATVKRVESGQLFLQLHIKGYNIERRTGGKAQPGDEVRIRVKNITGKPGNLDIELDPNIIKQ